MNLNCSYLSYMCILGHSFSVRLILGDKITTISRLEPNYELTLGSSIVYNSIIVRVGFCQLFQYDKIACTIKLTYKDGHLSVCSCTYQDDHLVVCSLDYEMMVNSCLPPHKLTPTFSLVFEAQQTGHHKKIMIHGSFS